jgi:hypothetical protein
VPGRAEIKLQIKINVMPIRKFFFSFTLLLLPCSFAFCQVFLQSDPIGTSRDGVLVVYGSNNLNSNQRIPYNKINGSPFWKDEYQQATLIDRNNQVLGKVRVKLNLYTNEVYFLSPSGEERVAAAGKVRKIIFHDDDSAKKIKAVFENNLPIITEANPRADNPSFVQVLNSGGDWQLLKLTRVLFNSGDSLFGTQKRYYFANLVLYFLNDKYGQITRLRKLNKDNIGELINIDSAAEAWCRQNSINFKKEEDIARFIDYYNTREK